MPLVPAARMVVHQAALAVLANNSNPSGGGVAVRLCAKLVRKAPSVPQKMGRKRTLLFDVCLIFVCLLFVCYLFVICLVICGSFMQRPCAHFELCSQSELGSVSRATYRAEDAQGARFSRWARS